MVTTRPSTSRHHPTRIPNRASRGHSRRLNASNALASTGVDHLYSVAAVTDATGNVVERYKYNAYGERSVYAPDGVTARDESAIGQPYGFTGRRYDSATGLWYFRARYYSAELGRFVRRDPLGYADGMGLYSAYYIPNLTDPTGLFDFDPNLPASDPAKAAAIESELSTYARWMGITVSEEFMTKVKRVHSIKRSAFDSYLTSGGVGPGDCSSPCTIVTVIVEGPVVGGEGFSDDPNSPGHAGIGVGKDFYDWGPADPHNVWGGAGGPHWGRRISDVERPNLAQIQEFIKNKSVFTAEICVCDNANQAIKKYWDDKYKNGGTYSPAGDHCANTVGASLNLGLPLCDKDKKQPRISGSSELVLLYELRQVTHGCGSNKGKRIKITSSGAD